MRNRFKTVVIGSVLVLALICLTANPLMAANPPTEGSRAKGPAVQADLFFYPDGVGEILFDGTGTCAGDPVEIELTSLSNDFDDINQESILDWFVNFQDGARLSDAISGGPALCIPRDKDTGQIDVLGLVVRAVIDYEDKGNVKWAKVILLFVY